MVRLGFVDQGKMMAGKTLEIAKQIVSSVVGWQRMEIDGDRFSEKITNLVDCVPFRRQIDDPCLRCSARKKLF
jgi:hypothetical protein